MAHMRLGDILISAKVITDEQLTQALNMQKGTGKRLGAILIENGFITEKQLVSSMETQLGIDFIDLSKINIPTEMAQVLSQSIAKKHNVVPVRASGDVLYLAMVDPLNFIAIEEVKTASKKRVIPMISSAAATSRAITTLYGNETAAKAIEEMKRGIGAEAVGTTAFNTSILDGDSDEAPTIRLVSSIITHAVANQASDIHVEPREKDLHVRMRIDGVMRNILTIPKALQAAVLSRFKVLGSMDIAEKRVPQDGRANVRVGDADIDLRISSLPTIYGEKIVVRLLDKSSQLFSKESLGMNPEDMTKYTSLLSQHHGIIMISGPTGSGKSSTLYTMISELNTEQVNLITLENPVEYNVDGVNQVQINEKAGITFANGLRSILRQDPDIIVVGEIRDGETAEIAMRAAITGHMVLTTIHTNDSLSTVDRLIDIGVEPYLVSNALRGVISQRLVRKICPHCKEKYQASPEELITLGLPRDSDIMLYRGTGCSMCFNTGYRGRTGVFEILVIDHELRTAISSGSKSDELRSIVEKQDFFTLEQSCLKLVLAGATTVSEAQRVIYSNNI